MTAGLFPEPHRLDRAPDVPQGFPVDVGPGRVAGPDGLRLRQLGEDGETFWAFGHVDPAAFVAATVAAIREDEQAYAAAFRQAGLEPIAWSAADKLTVAEVRRVTWRLQTPWCAQRGTRDEDAGPDAPERPACAEECGLDHCGPWGFVPATPETTLDGGTTFIATYLERKL